MKTTVRTEAEAVRASERKLFMAGWYHARITEAVEKEAQRSGREMIETRVVVTDADGNQREFRDFLNNSDLGAAKLRHACEAVGALSRYEAGAIGPDDFPGHDVQVKIGVQKGTRAFPGNRNVIEDYRAADSRIVNLRAG